MSPVLSVCHSSGHSSVMVMNGRRLLPPAAPVSSSPFVRASVSPRPLFVRVDVQIQSCHAGGWDAERKRRVTSFSM